MYHWLDGSSQERLLDLEAFGGFEFRMKARQARANDPP